MKKRLYVIIAILPFGDADVISVAETKDVAIEAWKEYMHNIVAFRSLSPADEGWITENSQYMTRTGVTNKHPALATFYRLCPVAQDIA